MHLETTRVFDENLRAYQLGKRRALNEGGTRASKTYSILQLLIYIAQKAQEKMLISVVSESMPHLKRGCIRDFTNILGDEFNPNRFNKTDFIYTFGNALIEFFAADDSSKLRGAGRDILFINEANNVSWDSYRELDIRTRQFTFLDWNPVGEFWVHENRLVDEPESAYIHSTYKDAVKVLPQEVVDNIESNEDKDPNWWNVYGLGLIGKIEGLVYGRFEQVDELPVGDGIYGLDFGFGSYDPLVLIGGDPTVLVKNVIIGDNLYSQQLFYERKPMTNDDIAREMTLLHIPPTAPIYPDPSEPKSAEAIRQKGFNVLETHHGAGSVKFGIKRVNSYYQFWTKDSLDCIKDQRNCKYIKRREPNSGREYLSDDITHQWSHGMDARRYAVSSHVFLIGKPVSKHSSFRF